MIYDLFSVDDHIIEHANVWTDRLPTKYHDKGPHVIEEDGREYWVWEGFESTQMGLNAVAGKPREQWTTEPTRFSDMLPGCYDPKERARDMELDGIRASLCFPSLAGFGGRVLGGFDDKELAKLCIEAYNDFHIDEWCAAARALCPTHCRAGLGPGDDGRRDLPLRGQRGPGTFLSGGHRVPGIALADE